MFRPGDPATTRTFPKTWVTILRAGEDGTWETDQGVMPESVLQMAHESCLPTMEGRHVEAEIMQARYKQDDLGGRISYEKTALLEGALKGAPRDLRGHWKRGEGLGDHRKDFEERMVDRIGLIIGKTPEADIDRVIAAAHPQAEPLAEWVAIGGVFGRGANECHLCGADDFVVETNGKEVRLAGDECPHPDGFPVTEWEMNVPSGKLVVANDLRSLFPLPEGDDDIESINTTLGCHQTTLAYAAVGMAHASVGNSCPSVYRIPQKAGGGYAVATGGVGRGAKRLAGICTDLWWYSMCDYDEFVRRCEKFSNLIVKKKRKGSKTPAEDPVKVALEHWSCEVVTMKPGVYRFYHDYNVDRNDYRVVYARFERVRDPDPVRDLLSSWESVEVNATAYVRAQVAKWPTLYANARHKKDAKPWSRMTEAEQHAAWQRVADHVFCTIGGGTDWHERGFPQAKVDPRIEDVPPPKFRAQFHWYPFSHPYGGLFEPKVLTPSFARVAFEVLESVISFGMHVRFGERCREVSYTRSRMLLAVERYRELLKENPGVADPDYAAWVTEPGRAEAWVGRFDLGPKVMQSHIDHQSKQVWIPEDTYAVEFDARKLGENVTGFAWHPKNPGVAGCWARKEDAQRWAPPLHKKNGLLDNEDDCGWFSNAGHSIPLYCVARVTRLGTVSHMGERLVEVTFDYGTKEMRDPSVRWGLREFLEKAALRPLTETEYQEAKPGAVAFYEAAEAVVRAKQKASA